MFDLIGFVLNEWLLRTTNLKNFYSTMFRMRGQTREKKMCKWQNNMAGKLNMI